MQDKEQNIQAQFSGFFNTPHLFSNPIFGMTPFLKTPSRITTFNAETNLKERLGHRVERFVNEELKTLTNCTVLAENIQIKREDNTTIGELDCLFLEDEKPIHLEIQFKFYLYDASLGTTEIDHCIGPMRKDSLNEKLSKLKEKQLPLLYANETKALLKSIKLNAEDFKQQIYFKAQLFMPYGKAIKLNTLNNDCICGFYFNYTDLVKFRDCKFYIPKKIDWLLDISTNVNWQTYIQVLPQLNTYKSENYSPMLWIKFSNGELSKCFVVSW